MRACRKLNHPYDEEDLVEMTFCYKKTGVIINSSLKISQA